MKFTNKKNTYIKVLKLLTEIRKVKILSEVLNLLNHVMSSASTKMVRVNVKQLTQLSLVEPVDCTWLNKLNTSFFGVRKQLLS